MTNFLRFSDDILHRGNRYSSEHLSKSEQTNLIGTGFVSINKSLKIESEDPGSPENPKMLKKFLYCTGITTVIFMIIYLLMKYEYLNLRDIIN